MIEIERRRSGLKPINMIPMINVVFLLLVFFMFAGQIEKVGIVPVELPAAVSGQLLDQGPVVILLGRHNELIVNDELIMPQDMQPVLAEQLSLNADRVITIKADSQLEARKMIEVMDMVKAVGGRNISLVTQSM